MLKFYWGKCLSSPHTGYGGDIYYKITIGYTNRFNVASLWCNRAKESTKSVDSRRNTQKYIKDKSALFIRSCIPFILQKQKSKLMLATYVPSMRNSNMKIRIAGCSCRPQQSLPYKYYDLLYYTLIT